MSKLKPNSFLSCLELWAFVMKKSNNGISKEIRSIAVPGRTKNLKINKKARNKPKLPVVNRSKNVNCLVIRAYTNVVTENANVRKKLRLLTKSPPNQSIKIAKLKPLVISL